MVEILCICPPGHSRDIGRPKRTESTECPARGDLRRMDLIKPVILRVLLQHFWHLTRRRRDLDLVVERLDPPEDCRTVITHITHLVAVGFLYLGVGLVDLLTEVTTYGYVPASIR